MARTQHMWEVHQIPGYSTVNGATKFFPDATTYESYARKKSRKENRQKLINSIILGVFVGIFPTGITTGHIDGQNKFTCNETLEYLAESRGASFEAWERQNICDAVKNTEGMRNEAYWYIFYSLMLTLAFRAKKQLADN